MDRRQITLTAKHALKYMVARGIALTPANYKEYFDRSAQRPADAQADETGEKEVGIESEYDALFDYVEKEKAGIKLHEDILRKQEQNIIKIMKFLYTIIDKLTKGAISHKNALEKERIEIEELTDLETLEEIGQRLIEEIDKITTSNDELQDKLQEANQKIKTLEENLDKMRQESTIDHLTGINNRRAFEQKISEELSRFQRYGASHALLMLDIDGFKQLNDTYGHVVGDAVLQKVGRIFRQNTRSSDFIGRYGGDEFVLLIPEASVEGAKNIATKLKEALDKTVFRYKDTEFAVSLSIGITAFKQGDAAKDVIQRADMALYNAKSIGKNTISVEE